MMSAHEVISVEADDTYLHLRENGFSNDRFPENTVSFIPEAALFSNDENRDMTEKGFLNNTTHKATQIRCDAATNENGAQEETGGANSNRGIRNHNKNTDKADPSLGNFGESSAAENRNSNQFPKQVHPLNRIFYEAFNGLRKDAKYKRDAKKSCTYKRALCTLAAYPLPIFNGCRAALLDGFGDKLTAVINHLRKYSNISPANLHKVFSAHAKILNNRTSSSNISAVINSLSEVDKTLLEDVQQHRNVAMKRFRDFLVSEIRIGELPISQRQSHNTIKKLEAYGYVFNENGILTVCSDICRKRTERPNAEEQRKRDSKVRKVTSTELGANRSFKTPFSGTGRWTLLLCLYTFSHFYKSRRMNIRAIESGVQKLGKMDISVYTGNIHKHLSGMVKDGLLNIHKPFLSGRCISNSSLPTKCGKDIITSKIEQRRAKQQLQIEKRQMQQERKRQKQKTRYSLTAHGEEVASACASSVSAPLLSLSCPCTQSSSDGKPSPFSSQGVVEGDELVTTELDGGFENDGKLSTELTTNPTTSEKDNNQCPKLDDTLYCFVNLESESNLSDTDTNGANDTENHRVFEETNIFENSISCIDPSSPWIDTDVENEFKQRKQLAEPKKWPSSPKVNMEFDLSLIKKKKDTNIPSFETNLLSDVLIECMQPPQLTLLIDQRERGYSEGAFAAARASGRRIQSNSYIQQILQRTGIPVEQRLLPIGDFCWVFRVCKKVDDPGKSLDVNVGPKLNRTAPTDKNDRYTPISSRSAKGSRCTTPMKGGEAAACFQEFVVPWLVERKTLSDLSASILDGRYSDQKQRMIASAGMERLVYLIEGPLPLTGQQSSSTISGQLPGISSTSHGGEHGSGTQLKMPRAAAAAILTAHVRTLVEGGFHVLNSCTPEHSAGLLGHLYHKIQRYLINQWQALHKPEFTLINTSEMFHETLSQCDDGFNYVTKWDLWKAKSKTQQKLTLQELLCLQLQVVPGVGRSLAFRLACAFETSAKVRQFFRGQLDNEKESFRYSKVTNLNGANEDLDDEYLFKLFLQRLGITVKNDDISKNDDVSVTVPTDGKNDKSVKIFQRRKPIGSTPAKRSLHQQKGLSSISKVFYILRSYYNFAGDS